MVVVGELGEHRARVARVLALEIARPRAGGGAHGARPASARERGLLEQRVREAPARGGVAARASSTPAAHRLVDAVERGARARAPPPRRPPSGEVAAEHRAAATSDGAAGESRSSGRRIRSSACAGSATALRAARAPGWRSSPRSREQAQRLAQEERHALGAREQLRGEVGRRRAPEHLLEQRRDLARARRPRARSRGSASCCAQHARACASPGEPGSRGSSRTVASTSSGASAELVARGARAGAATPSPPTGGPRAPPAAGARRRGRASARVTASKSRKRLCSGREPRARGAAPAARAGPAGRRARRARPRSRAAPPPRPAARAGAAAPARTARTAGTPSPSRARPTSTSAPARLELGGEHLGEPRLADAGRAPITSTSRAAARRASREGLAQLRERVVAADEGALAARRAPLRARRRRPARARRRSPRRRR